MLLRVVLLFLILLILAVIPRVQDILLLYQVVRPVHVHGDPGALPLHRALPDPHAADARALQSLLELAPDAGLQRVPGSARVQLGALAAALDPDLRPLPPLLPVPDGGRDRGDPAQLGHGRDPGSAGTERRRRRHRLRSRGRLHPPA